MAEVKLFLTLALIRSTNGLVLHFHFVHLWLGIFMISNQLAGLKSNESEKK